MVEESLYIFAVAERRGLGRFSMQLQDGDTADIEICLIGTLEIARARYIHRRQVDVNDMNV